MGLSDYLKGPAHKARAEELQQELGALRERYGQLQELAKKYGAMDAAEVQRQIEEAKGRLQVVRDEIAEAERSRATMQGQLQGLRAQVLVVEETLLLESFALYHPKFQLTSTAEYKARLDDTRTRQKAMIKAGTAARPSWRTPASSHRRAPTSCCRRTSASTPATSSSRSTPMASRPCCSTRTRRRPHRSRPDVPLSRLGSESFDDPPKAQYAIFGCVWAFFIGAVR